MLVCCLKVVGLELRLVSYIASNDGPNMKEKGRETVGKVVEEIFRRRPQALPHWFWQIKIVMLFVSDDAQQISNGIGRVLAVLAQVLDQPRVKRLEPIVSDDAASVRLEVHKNRIWWIPFHNFEAIRRFAEEVQPLVRGPEEGMQQDLLCCRSVIKKRMVSAVPAV